MYNRAIHTVKDVEKFFRYLVDVRRVNFHPDTDFAEYVSSDTGSKTFTDREVNYYNSLMNACFEICTQAGVDIYEIGLKVLKGALKA
jgi:hypothetical protein